jgi:hypothetical protein
MRCYFHLVNGRDELIDGKGVESSDLQSAKAQALMAISELQQESVGIDEEWNGWCLNIHSAEGTLLLSIPLYTTLH